MKHTLTKLNDTTIKVVVAASGEDLTEAKSKALERLARNISAPGFRKGKVPLNVAEKNVDPEVLANEVIQSAINQTLNEVISVEDLRVLDQPKVDVTKFVPYTELEYAAEISIVPDIKLGNYKKLKSKKVAKEVTKADVDEV